jgi:hypothetical protein
MTKSLRVPLLSKRQNNQEPSTKEYLEAMNTSAATCLTVDSDDDNSTNTTGERDEKLQITNNITNMDDENDNDVERSLKRSSTMEALQEMREELERMRMLKLRQELEALKLQAKIKERQRQHELQQVQIKSQMAQTKLQEQLERTHSPMYMKFLTCEYLACEERKRQNPDREVPTSAPAVVSTVVLQSETPLLSVMHRAFLVFPNQMEWTKKLSKRYVEKFLKEQIRSLRRENVKISVDVVQKLSQKAEENDQLYETYQKIVQHQGEEIRKLQRAQENKMKEEPLKGTSDHSETSSTALEDFESSSSSFWEIPIPSLSLRMPKR